MFVAEENVTEKSHVTFYRCSLCISEPVSATPIIESPSAPLSQYAGEHVRMRVYDQRTSNWGNISLDKWRWVMDVNFVQKGLN